LLVAVDRLAVFKFKGVPERDFVLQETLSSLGGSKSVFRGKLVGTGVPVCVKRIDADDDEAKSALLEVELLSNVRSPHIVVHLGAYRHDAFVYVISEFVPAGTVQSLLDLCGALDVPSVQSVLVAVVSALLALHQRGICHRNVKPSVMLVGSAGEVKLSGFGLSVQLQKLQKMGTWCGTPRYLAPELISGAQYDNAVDIWALGAAACAMVTGHVLYAALPPVQALFTISQLKAPPPVVRDVKAINAELGDVVLRCLQIDPAIRATPDELLMMPFLAAGRAGSLSLAKLDEADDRKDAAAKAASPAAAAAATAAPAPASTKPALARTVSSVEREKLLKWLVSAAAQQGAARGALAAMARTKMDPDEWIKENFSVVSKLADMPDEKRRRDELRQQRDQIRARRPAAASDAVPPQLTMRGVAQMRTMRIDASASIVNFNMGVGKALPVPPQQPAAAHVSPRLRQRKLLSRHSARLMIAIPGAAPGKPAIAVTEAPAPRKVDDTDERKLQLRRWEHEQERDEAERKQRAKEKEAADEAKKKTDEAEATAKKKADADAAEAKRKSDEAAAAKRKADEAAAAAVEAKHKAEADAAAKKRVEAEAAAATKRKADEAAAAAAAAAVAAAAEAKKKGEAEVAAAAKKKADEAAAAEAKHKAEADVAAKKRADDAAAAKKKKVDDAAAAAETARKRKAAVDDAAASKKRVDALVVDSKAAKSKSKSRDSSPEPRARSKSPAPPRPAAPSGPTGPQAAPQRGNVGKHVQLAPDLDERLSLSAAEQALADAVCQLRADPNSFATMIEKERLPNYDAQSNGLILGNVCWQTCEGQRAAAEAIAFLRAMDPLPAASVKPGMVKAARRALKANADAPNSLALLPGYGGAAGSIEQLLCSGMVTAHDVLMALLISDGDPSRNSRAALTARSMRAFGVALVPHASEDQQTLILIAETFVDGLFDP
jgi:hypothetical protein